MKSTISLFFLFTILVINAQSNDSINKTPKDLIGIKMPEILNKSISGNTWNDDALKGKVVVLNFWFIRCMPCMKEIKYLNKLQKKYKKENFILLSIAPNVKQDLIDFNSDSVSMYSTMRKDFAKAKIEYEIIPECTEKTLNIEKNIKFDCNEISSLFNISRYPTTLIINQKGIVEYVKTGFGNKLSKSKETLEYDPGYEKIIDKLLQNPAYNTK